MLENAKEIIETATDETTKVDFTNLGLSDRDIVELKELLEKKPQIVEVNLTRNNMRANSGKVLAELKSLRRIIVAQNSLGDAGARFLLAKEDLEYLDLSDNDITFNIAELLTKRRAAGLVIATQENPRLNPNYSDLGEDAPILRQTNVTLQTTTEPSIPGEKRLSGAESAAKFGLRHSPNEASSLKSSPDTVDVELERQLRQQLEAYRASNPKRCEEFLKEEMNRHSSISNNKLVK